MRLPPEEAPQRPHDAKWRKWSARMRGGLVALPKPNLLKAVAQKGFQNLTNEDQAAVLAHLATSNTPDLAREPLKDAVEPERDAAGKAKPQGQATATTPHLPGRRPLPLDTRGLRCGSKMSVRLWLRYAWPWLLPLSALTTWAAVLLAGHAWILQHSVVG